MQKIRWLTLFLFGILFWVVFSGIVFLIILINIVNPYSNYQSIQTIKIWSGIEQDLVSNIKFKLNKIENLFLNTKESLSSDKYKKFDTIWNILFTKYFDVDKLNFDNMREEALKGFVEAIWDPYTVYLTKQENSNFQEELKWSQDFEWIGAVVTKKKDWVMIEEVLKWYPAYKSWLKPLDLIIEINWETTKDMSLSEAVSKIRWPAGTEVELTIYRESENKVFKVKVKREKISVPSVRQKIFELTWWVKIGYIEIAIIWQDTEESFKKAVKNLKSQNVKWIILDLRWNWGWYLPIAVEVASHFVPKGKIIVSTKYRVYPEEVYKSYWYGDFENYPVVVLVDWLTASASEIISAALREDIWAKLVWTKTFGKWSIQTMENFDDGSSLKYTIWKWYTPKWENVDQKWLNPDIEIEFDKKLFLDKNIDNQLEKAKEVIFKMIKK